MNRANRGEMTNGTSPAPVIAANDIMQSRRPRARTRLIMLAICAGIVFSGFFALGTWQLFRLQWKLDLIERVEQRVHAPPIAAPGPERWAQINAAADEYRHVRVSGIFLYPLTARVQASTERGSGFWLLTPLRTADGSIVLINRGFVPARQGDWTRPFRDDTVASGISTVTGLLRISEPGGGFLRHNDPVADRWYSRDVAAIAAARHLSNVAPYFIDDDAAKIPDEEMKAGAADRPVGGLTVIAFHNNHLVYAFTWYALALMVAGGCIWVVRAERKSPRRAGDTDADGFDRESEDGNQN